MSDPKTTETKLDTAAPSKDKFQAGLEGEHPQAKRGVKDAGGIVSSAGGELIDGRIADITDGDR
ncbi:MAG TPA: hypothetical protein VMU93_11105 [Caulobacteraceae bacterium]|nr:hypothetical protein [Caulobacteraceae bacterium]